MGRAMPPIVTLSWLSPGGGSARLTAHFAAGFNFRPVVPRLPFPYRAKAFR